MSKRKRKAARVQKRAVPAKPAANVEKSWQLPLIGRSKGRFGTSWDTDLTLHNPNGEAVVVEATWLAADRDNRADNPRAEIVLAPGETRLVKNTPNTLWSVEEGNGSVMLSSDEEVVVEARTWTPVPNGLPGTMGQRITPIDLAYPRIAPRVLSWVREDEDVRTNVGFVNRSSHVKVLELRLFRSDGVAIREGEIMLAPQSVSQRSMDVLFGGDALDAGESGWIEIVDGATGDIEIFASQVSNDSGAPMFVMGR